MKNQTTGISDKTLQRDQAYVYPDFRYNQYDQNHVVSSTPPFDRNLVSGSALENYKSNRTNGADKDSPTEQPLSPQDGKFFWEKNEIHSRVLYIPGPKDEEWMNQRDRKSSVGVFCSKML